MEPMFNWLKIIAYVVKFTDRMNDFRRFQRLFSVINLAYLLSALLSKSLENI